MTLPEQTTVRGQLTVLRPASDEDVDLLVAWHADPEVSRYWDGETFTREQMQARLEREPVDAWIIEADGEPVGYLQSWWEEARPRRGGLDGFLLPDARGRGLMPDAARALAQSLLADGWQYVTVDPYAWNERALRGWAKAGFVEVSRHEADSEHVSRWVLMRFAPEDLRAVQSASGMSSPSTVSSVGSGTGEPASSSFRSSSGGSPPGFRSGSSTECSSRLVARTSSRRYPFPHEREPDDDDDDAAPRAAFGRRIARGITQQQATS